MRLGKLLFIFIIVLASSLVMAKTQPTQDTGLGSLPQDSADAFDGGGSGNGGSAPNDGSNPNDSSVPCIYAMDNKTEIVTSSCPNLKSESNQEPDEKTETVENSSTVPNVIVGGGTGNDVKNNTNRTNPSIVEPEILQDDEGISGNGQNVNIVNLQNNQNGSTIANDNQGAGSLGNGQGNGQINGGGTGGSGNNALGGDANGIVLQGGQGVIGSYAYRVKCMDGTIQSVFNTDETSQTRVSGSGYSALCSTRGGIMNWVKVGNIFRGNIAPLAQQ